MKKYEQEIRELLEKMDRESFVQENPTGERERDPRRKVVGVVPPAPRPLRPKQTIRQRFTHWLADHNINRGLAWMLGGYAVAISGMVLAGEVLRNNASFFWIVQVLLAIGGLMFLTPVAVRFFTGQDINNNAKTWRGEVVNDEPIFTWSKVKQWFSSGRNNNGRGGGRDPWNNRRNDRW